ncbi:hypothetical protein JT354_gp48 [Serratia phage JS26]|uniref:Uncharacterized protein n=1 Tax=Serratia phage JS26 TaxID=2315217 RepID=A0A5Q2F1Z1_9CAUD|nr:hypothetical protein JT354_gp48 [Serratia phage JS26]QGF20914.1 hypothetical protein [Serratia phage JS26]
MVTDESQMVRPSRGLSLQSFMGLLPFLLTVVCLFGSCLMYISALDAKNERNAENLQTLRNDMKDLETRTNGKIDEQARRSETQYQNIRADMQEVNRKLDQLIMNGSHGK